MNRRDALQVTARIEEIVEGEIFSVKAAAAHLPGSLDPLTPFIEGGEEMIYLIPGGQKSIVVEKLCE